MRELSQQETQVFMADTDALLEKALDVLVSERGTPLVVVLDRMMTRVAALIHASIMTIRLAER